MACLPLRKQVGNDVLMSMGLTITAFRSVDMMCFSGEEVSFSGEGVSFFGEEVSFSKEGLSFSKEGLSLCGEVASS